MPRRRDRKFSRVDGARGLPGPNESCPGDTLKKEEKRIREIFPEGYAWL